MEWVRRSAGFFTLLDELTIARSRKHIQKYLDVSLYSFLQILSVSVSEKTEISCRNEMLDLDRYKFRNNKTPNRKIPSVEANLDRSNRNVIIILPTLHFARGDRVAQPFPATSTHNHGHN